MPRDENMIAALKRERAGYVAQGKDDRVAEVDEQLKYYGYEPPAEATGTDGAPKGRKSPEAAKQTADGRGAQEGAAKPEDGTTAKPSSQTAAQKRAAGGKA
jgi:hypothetical protein